MAKKNRFAERSRTASAALLKIPASRRDKDVEKAGSSDQAVESWPMRLARNAAAIPSITRVGRSAMAGARRILGQSSSAVKSWSMAWGSRAVGRVSGMSPWYWIAGPVAPGGRGRDDRG